MEARILSNAHPEVQSIAQEISMMRLEDKNVEIKVRNSEMCLFT
jgi:hypothetical protein